jgi:hypothetical protein
MTTHLRISDFVRRLKRLNIEVELFANYPWIYLGKINGKRVTEKFESEHGFCIGLTPVMKGQDFRFTDIGEIFKLIRKYLN